jgi:hypothetical protein
MTSLIAVRTSSRRRVTAGPALSVELDMAVDPIDRSSAMTALISATSLSSGSGGPTDTFLRSLAHAFDHSALGCAVAPNEIHLHDYSTDPFRFPDYDGFVSRAHCGRTIDCGQPAAEVLQSELQFLGQLLDRDLVNELKVQAAEKT